MITVAPRSRCVDRNAAGSKEKEDVSSHLVQGAWIEKRYVSCNTIPKTVAPHSRCVDRNIMFRKRAFLFLIVPYSRCVDRNQMQSIDFISSSCYPFLDGCG